MLKKQQKEKNELENLIEVTKKKEKVKENDSLTRRFGY